jgi:hypothetical protein
MVAHSVIPATTGGRDQEDYDSEGNMDKRLTRPYLNQ